MPAPSLSFPSQKPLRGTVSAVELAYSRSAVELAEREGFDYYRFAHVTLPQ
jgi:hypothetical protein